MLKYGSSCPASQPVRRRKEDAEELFYNRDKHLANRATDLYAHYTDAGLMPSTVLVQQVSSRFAFSLNLLNGEALFQALLFVVAMLTALSMLVRLPHASYDLCRAGVAALDPVVHFAGQRLREPHVTQYGIGSSSTRWARSGLPSGCALGPGREAGPDVVLVIADSVRRDHVSAPM